MDEDNLVPIPTFSLDPNRSKYQTTTDVNDTLKRLNSSQNDSVVFVIIFLVFIIIYSIIWIVSIIDILSTNFKKSGDKIAWLLATIFIPFLGIVYLVGFKKRK